MPSREPKPPPLPDHHPHHHLPPFLLPIAAASAALLLLVVLLAILYRCLSRGRAAPSDQTQPRRFSYSALRRTTASFAPCNKLGQGGFGSVYRADLPKPLAVKLLDSSSLQCDREFHNELSVAPLINGSDRVVPPLGFSSHRRRAHLLLVYNLMPNGSLQEAMLDRRRSELMVWSCRFAVALDVARGLLFLHVSCDPPIIHGDIKPSNILLDSNFSAKIADFGLAHVKASIISVQIPSPDPKHHQQDESDSESAAAETESVTTATTMTSMFEFGNQIDNANVNHQNGNEAAVLECHSQISNLNVNHQKGNETTGFVCDSQNQNRNGNSVTQEEPSEILDNSNFDDRMGVESSRRKRKTDESGGIKDYVMEWIGKEVKKERPKSNWIESDRIRPLETERKKQQRQREWWATLDDEKIGKKEKCRNWPRQPREWWREEFCEELSKKNKKRNINKNKKRIAKVDGSGDVGELRWQMGDTAAELAYNNKKKSRSWNRSSSDWWMDGLSSEFVFGRHCSKDCVSGEIPKSGGVSSTPSMRGTVCYTAPEYSGGGPLSEQSDVYSYGVLLLVIVSGRRPLQVTASPMSEFERANLISWARHLARRGKLLDLVDPAIQGLDQEQALLCIMIALRCLQRSPAQRPSIKEVVGMLSGECEPPHLPMEFSPSPPSGFAYKSRKKAR